MHKNPFSTMFMAVVTLGAGGPALAGHHLWDVHEIFSNADGTIQFIELWESTGDNAENGIGPFGVTSNANTFQFVTNLPPGDTGFKFVLLATSGFAALPGAVTPDYIIPDNFFSINGDSINYAGGLDILTFGLGVLPTDGVVSLNRDLTTGTNSPTNFAGAIGSIDLSGPEVPALSTWGLAVMAALLVAASAFIYSRRQRHGAAAW